MSQDVYWAPRWTGVAKHEHRVPYGAWRLKTVDTALDLLRQDWDGI